MRTYLAVLLAALLVAIAISAPLPRQRPAKPRPQPKPHAGLWIMQWSGGRYDVVLRADGTYAASPGDWQGYWSWDEKKRLWHVRETTNQGASWLEWSVPLDAELKGEGALSSGGKADISIAENDASGPKL